MAKEEPKFYDSTENPITINEITENIELKDEAKLLVHLLKIEKITLNMLNYSNRWTSIKILKHHPIL